MNAKAAEQGHYSSQYNLANMYAQGQGTTQNYKEALKWYKQSAEQGDSEAQYNLGVMYQNGYGTTKNYILAHMYFNISAANGFESSINLKEIVSREMTPLQIEEAQRLAQEWITLHAK